MLKKLILLIVCLLFFVPNAPTYAHLLGFQIEDKVVPYKDLSNEILFGRRCIAILIDEKDFSVNNLKVLMNQFFKDYPNEERLWVFVATDLAHVYDFAEYSDQSYRPGAKHPCGSLFREKDKEFIRYKLPGEELQTIVIKE